MKLDNFPTVLWINLDRSLDRKAHMEKLLEENSITHHRISAVNGADQLELDSVCIRDGTFKNSTFEFALTCSYLKAMRYFVDHLPNEKRIIMFEDDTTFEFSEFISYDWSEFESNLPSDYETIQLCINVGLGKQPDLHLKRKYPQNPNGSLTYRDEVHWSSGATLITKTCAEKLLAKYYRENGKFDLTRPNITSYIVSDAIIYQNKCYRIPLFTYLDIESIIQNKPAKTHITSKNSQIKLWKAFSERAFDPKEYFGKFEKYQ